MPRRHVPLSRLREHRNPRDRDLSLSAEIARVAADLSRRRRSAGAGAEAWAAVAPPALHGLAEATSVNRGVLTLKAPGAAARFAVDRWLRSGGEAELIRYARVGIKRVKLAP
jgi:hypothetical protein